MIKSNTLELHGTIVIAGESLSTSEFYDKFFQMLQDNGMSYTGFLYQLDDDGNYIDDLTFCDLYSYIQTAERDGVGMHYIEGMNPYTLHIYSNRMQVNLCKNGDPIANFVFTNDPDEVLSVKLIRVNENMIADYDNPVKIEANECIDQEGTWYLNKFGANGIAVRDAIIGILNPVKVKQIKHIQEKINNVNKALAGY